MNKDFWKNKNVLITGIYGFVGSNLCKKLMELKANVFGIYKNNSSSFSTIGAGITGVKNGSSNWIDYDQDGDLDLLITGDDGSNKIATLYQNANGTFTDASAGFTGVHLSSSFFSHQRRKRVRRAV